MREIVMYRYMATGVFGYDCYDKKHLICSLSSLVGCGSALNITCGVFAFSSFFHHEDTLVPRISKRHIVDGTGAQIATLRWDGEGKYMLLYDGIEIRVSVWNGTYVFSVEENIVAVLGKVRDREHVPDHVVTEAGFDYVAAFRCLISGAVSDTSAILEALILSCPMLCFAF